MLCRRLFEQMLHSYFCQEAILKENAVALTNVPILCQIGKD